MASFVGFSLPSGSSGSNFLVDKPAGIREGDVMVAQVLAESGSSTLAPPAGWTQLGPQVTSASPAAGETIIAYEVDDGTAGPIEFPFPFGFVTHVMLLAYHGVGAPVAFTVTPQGSTATDPVENLGVALPRHGMVAFFANSGTASASTAPPAGFAQRINQSATGFNFYEWLLAGDLLNAAAGATGTLACSGAAGSGSFSVSSAIALPSRGGLGMLV